MGKLRLGRESCLLKVTQLGKEGERPGLWACLSPAWERGRLERREQKGERIEKENVGEKR